MLFLHHCLSSWAGPEKGAGSRLTALQVLMADVVEPTLALQLERLETVQHPLLQRLAVAAIFQQLAKPAAGHSRASEAALQACTGHQEQVCLDACSGIQGADALAYYAADLHAFAYSNCAARTQAACAP